MLGRRVSLEGLSWLNTPGAHALSLKGKVTLVRWWTDKCPFCARSLAAIEWLRERFAGRGLQTLAVYHPKPPRDVKPDVVLQVASTIGYSGWVASDLQWNNLRKLVPDIHSRRSTSVSFLIDENGMIRYVHPGPVFGPGDDPAQQKGNQDFLDIVRAIEDLLSEI
ncbi:MAG: peroxiredoxin family protein [Planctomycetota bacterium]